MRKSKWLPGFIKTTIPADSMVLDGIVINQRKDGKYRIGKYENGKKIEMTYHDSTGNKIDSNEFYGILYSQTDPEQGTNHFIISGIKTRKSKKLYRGKTRNSTTI